MEPRSNTRKSDLWSVFDGAGSGPLKRYKMPGGCQIFLSNHPRKSFSSFSSRIAITITNMQITFILALVAFFAVTGTSAQPISGQAEPHHEISTDLSWNGNIATADGKVDEQVGLEKRYCSISGAAGRRMPACI
ncbi:hypothetical protein D9611_006571 [Ephemerocybe angulata]|uniref:Uncharacterized protein n=1 Tax=Ephemerocybe angulata TaxID=980116 RepID=A0A8H5C776_9AGAR|nr:hypothetical protein D9611_006571 [Tulosesus angulatus]